MFRVNSRTQRWTPLAGIFAGFCRYWDTCKFFRAFLQVRTLCSKTQYLQKKPIPATCKIIPANFFLLFYRFGLRFQKPNTCKFFRAFLQVRTSFQKSSPIPVKKSQYLQKPAKIPARGVQRWSYLKS